MKKESSLKKTKRNEEIYREYMDTPATIDDLADKHNLTRSRIWAIIQKQVEYEQYLIESANKDVS